MASFLIDGNDELFQENFIFTSFTHNGLCFLVVPIEGCQLCSPICSCCSSSISVCVVAGILNLNNKTARKFFVFLVMVNAVWLRSNNKFDYCIDISNSNVVVPYLYMFCDFPWSVTFRYVLC